MLVLSTLSFHTRLDGVFPVIDYNVHVQREDGSKENNEKLQWKRLERKQEVSRGMWKVDKVKPIDGSCSFPLATVILLASQ